MTVRLLDFAITDESKELQPLNRIEHHKGPLYVSGNRLQFLLRQLKAMESIAEGSREPDLESDLPVLVDSPVPFEVKRIHSLHLTTRIVCPTLLSPARVAFRTII